MLEISQHNKNRRLIKYTMINQPLVWKIKTTSLHGALWLYINSIFPIYSYSNKNRFFHIVIALHFSYKVVKLNLFICFFLRAIYKIFCHNIWFNTSDTTSREKNKTISICQFFFCQKRKMHQETEKNIDLCENASVKKHECIGVHHFYLLQKQTEKAVNKQNKQQHLIMSTCYKW